MAIQCHRLATSSPDDAVDEAERRFYAYRSATASVSQANSLLISLRTTARLRLPRDASSLMQATKSSLLQAQDAAAHDPNCDKPSANTVAAITEASHQATDMRRQLLQELRDVRAEIKGAFQQADVQILNSRPRDAKSQSVRLDRASQAVDAKVIAEEKRIADPCLDVICGQGLASSVDAGVVAALNKDNAWNSFNTAQAWGMNGNVDIVIRLNSVGDFSVKGMRFDASKVAEVARKMSVQTVLLATQMAGVPPTKPASGDSTDATDSGGAQYAAGSDYASVLQKQAKRDALVQARKESLANLALSIANSESQIDRGGDALTSANTAIQARFSGYEPTLRLSDYP
jgi:hypothetical protein